MYEHIASSIKSELEGENSRFSDSQTQSTSDSCQRLSFVENKDKLEQLVRKNINVSAMRSFLAKVKHNSTKLSVDEELDWLQLAISCIDLTTLSGDDTLTNVERLCYRSIHAMYDDKLADQYKDLTCAAVCVYPARVTDCARTFKRLDAIGRVNIASVATGFPSGQYGLATRLAEVEEAVKNGANEIDVVINRAAALAGQWVTVYDEICKMRRACDVLKSSGGPKVHLKVIIGAGDLLTSTPSSIYKASLISILAGANFIKTSTGKESVNATLPIGYIMMRCIVDYYKLTGICIGFKPAGGIRTYKDALQWLMLVKMLLGPEWLDKRMFRFGASGLLDDLEKRVLVLRRQKKLAEIQSERIGD